MAEIKGANRLFRFRKVVNVLKAICLVYSMPVFKAGMQIVNEIRCIVSPVMTAGMPAGAVIRKSGETAERR